MQSAGATRLGLGTAPGPPQARALARGSGAVGQRQCFGQRASRGEPIQGDDTDGCGSTQRMRGWLAVRTAGALGTPGPRWPTPDQPSTGSFDFERFRVTTGPAVSRSIAGPSAPTIPPTRSYSPACSILTGTIEPTSATPRLM